MSEEPAGPAAPAAAAVPPAEAMEPVSAVDPDPAALMPPSSADPAAPSDAPPPAARRPLLRRRIVPIAALVVAVALIAGGFWGWSAATQNRYESAGSTLQSQLDTETSAAHAFDARLLAVQGLATRIHSVVDSPAFASLPIAQADALRQSLATVDALAQAPAAVAPDSSALEAADDSGYRPPWQLTGDAEQLEGATRASQQTSDGLAQATDAAKTAEDSLDAAEAAYFEGVAVTADQTLAANTLANKSRQVALENLVAEARNPMQSAARDGGFLASLTDAESQVVASQASNQAQLNDPSWAVRNEIESYARSISHGVALEFVWAPEVSGLGSNWLSGTAETYDTDGGYAIISLNYTIEDAWSEGRDARALVTHEVGHTQVYRCSTLFASPAFNRDQEMWATAWSISQGFDVPGSGIEAYGRPTDEQISVAGQCR
ncbi:hypothetical protein [Subtercola sp. YIM 133946]|uniref:hypothetical protein n=1 Tax=Subtercola sp. YIM 133946 TaxID=3118909 RepID=UPI002F921354